MPHIVAYWKSLSDVIDVTNHNYTINIFPQSVKLSRILSKILQTFNWKEFIVLYEDENSISRLSSIIQYDDNSDKKIPIYQLPPDSEFRPFLKYLSKSGINHYIVDCSVLSWLKFIDAGMQFNMTKEYIVSEIIIVL